MDNNSALVITSGWLGDFVWQIPTLKALCEKYPNLSLVVSKQQALLAQGLLGDGIVGQVFVDDKTNRRQTARDVRAAAKDSQTVIDFDGKLKTGMYIPRTWRSQVFIPDRANTREFWLAKLLHPFARSMPPRDISGHKVDEFLSILPAFDIRDPKIDFTLNFSQEVIDRAGDIIEKLGRDTGKKVVLNVGSAQFSKIWPIERFYDLAQKLSRKGIQVVIMGADNFPWNKDYDLTVGQPQFSDFSEGIVLIRDSDLMTNAYLLGSGIFDISVGNDSFGNHMAGSTNEVPAGTIGAIFDAKTGKYFKASTRTVTLMGPTEPRHCSVYDPTRSFHEIIRPGEYDKLTAPCLGERCTYNGTDNACPKYAKVPFGTTTPCMSQITVEMVEGSVMSLLAQK